VPVILYDNEWIYHPVFIARYSLASLNGYLSYGKYRYKESFINCLKWITANYVKEGDLIKWFYNFDLKEYGVKAPWISGMAQGQLVSVLLRAYFLLKNKEYLEIADGAINTMITPIEKGGTLSIDQYGVWIEEVPSKPPSHILNGFIFALAGLYEYMLVRGRKKKIFNTLINSLKRNTVYYDLNYWSLYDLYYYRPASIKYHIIHVKQLKWLYLITGYKEFKRVSEKWYKNMDKVNTLMLLIMKRALRKLKLA